MVQDTYNQATKHVLYAYNTHIHNDICRHWTISTTYRVNRADRVYLLSAVG